MVRTGPNAFAAIDAAGIRYLRLAITNPDGFSGAALDAIGAANTQVPV